jgi:predicted enzyme related to lactoylglutathione lyase
MPETDRYIPGVPCWIDLTPPDPEAAAEFYGELFGWELENTMPAGVPGKYFMARLNGGDVAAIGSQPEGAPPRAAWNMYVRVESADDTAAKVREAGGSVLTEPFDVFDAGRMAACADPEGATFCVWQPNQHRGASVVNEPGSLNFNDLRTRDPEGATRFYGAVFGWQTLEMGGGVAMWTLPAYGDHLESRDPGMRERMREMGAPERFEESVASLNPIPDDQPDTPPHWGLTFAVDDADAIARRAAELGGTVVVPPFDAPWVRMTVITDPQGATFTASKFVPENKGVAVQEADAAVRGS